MVSPRKPKVFTPETDWGKHQLRKVIVKLANLLKTHNFFVNAYCNDQWCEKLTRMSGRDLKFEFRRLLSICGARKIGRLFKKGFLGYSDAVIKVMGDYFIQRNLTDLPVLEHLMTVHTVACNYGVDNEDESDIDQTQRLSNEDERGNEADDEVDESDDGSMIVNADSDDDVDDYNQIEDEDSGNSTDSDNLDQLANLSEADDGEENERLNEINNQLQDPEIAAAMLYDPPLVPATPVRRRRQRSEDDIDLSNVRRRLEDEFSSPSNRVPPENQERVIRTPPNNNTIWRPFLTTPNTQTHGITSPLNDAANECVQVGGGGESEDKEFELQPPGIRFEIVGEQEQYVQRFEVSGRKLFIRIKQPPNDCNLVLWLEAAVTDIYAYLTSLVENENDFIGISVTSDCFNHGPGGLSLRPAENFFYRDLWSLISNLTQSNENFTLNDTFSISVTLVKIPHGSGNRRALNLTIDVANQRSIVSINNDDNLCLP